MCMYNPFTSENKLAHKAIITTQEQLENVVADVIKHINAVLYEKSKTYTDAGDRLANFRVAGAMQGISPERALVGMWAKHVVSLLDLVKWVENDDPRLSEVIINEKLIDSINYMILLKALFAEHFRK